MAYGLTLVCMVWLGLVFAAAVLFALIFLIEHATDRDISEMLDQYVWRIGPAEETLATLAQLDALVTFGPYAPDPEMRA